MKMLIEPGISRTLQILPQCGAFTSFASRLRLARHAGAFSFRIVLTNIDASISPLTVLSRKGKPLNGRTVIAARMTHGGTAGRIARTERGEFISKSGIAESEGWLRKAEIAKADVSMG